MGRGTNLGEDDPLVFQLRHQSGPGDTIVLQFLARSRPGVVVLVADVLKVDARIFEEQAAWGCTISLISWGAK